jgi:hypothetical protein
LLLNRPSECYVLFRHFDWEAIDFVSEDDFKDRYNQTGGHENDRGQALQARKHEPGKRASKSAARQRHGPAREKGRAHVHEATALQRRPKCRGKRHVKGALDVEGMLGLSIEEIQTTKDFEILGHIAEARRLMGLALAPQIIEYATDFLEGSDEKLVIFGWHIDVLSLYEEGLSRFGTVRFDSRKSANSKQATSG